mmetsp:Transcript_32869/g.77886  ORF Transcript_32869/g.77886 Transcript_32869/m.77886 type:complete len:213 (-) Transcript_32869:444-1082(-)
MPETHLQGHLRRRARAHLQVPLRLPSAHGGARRLAGSAGAFASAFQRLYAPGGFEPHQQHQQLRRCVFQSVLQRRAWTKQRGCEEKFLGRSWLRDAVGILGNQWLQRLRGACERDLVILPESHREYRSQKSRRRIRLFKGGVRGELQNGVGGVAGEAHVDRVLLQKHILLSRNAVRDPKRRRRDQGEQTAANHVFDPGSRPGALRPGPAPPS